MTGVLYALGAMFAWGFGDFSAQKAARRIGIWETLFLIALTGSIGFFPFARTHIAVGLAETRDVFMLFIAAFIMLSGLLLNLHALSRGKLSVVEPIIALELPFVALLGFLFFDEHLGTLPFIIMFIVLAGIMLTITKSVPTLKYHKRMLEKGAILAFFGAIGLACINLSIGIASRETSPIFAIWFLQTIITIICFIYLLGSGGLFKILKSLHHHWLATLFVCILGNLAWIFYANAVLYLPIPVVTMITECYVVIATVLGILVNGERLMIHQIVGAGISISAVIFLSSVIGG